jgi:hypothetical protein
MVAKPCEGLVKHSLRFAGNGTGASLAVRQGQQRIKVR